MSRIVLIAVCIAVVVQSFQKTWIVASWNMNRTLIASTLCENRFQKESSCGGTCYLNKQLKENEQQEQSAPVDQKQKTEYVSELFVYDFILDSFFIPVLTFSVLWTSGEPSDLGESLFHPPTLLG